MNRKRRERIERERAAIETTFRVELVKALHICAAGCWGLFDQNEGVALADHLKAEIRDQSGAGGLHSLGLEIDALEAALGFAQPSVLLAKYCGLRGRKSANGIGEPGLARAWRREWVRKMIDTRPSRGDSQRRGSRFSAMHRQASASTNRDRQESSSGGK